MDPLLTLFSYLLLGAVAGVLAGLLGVGGGIVVVPALFFLFRLQGLPPELLMHLAVGSSLATVIFTAIASTRAHHRHGAVLWPVVLRMAPGIVLGALAGAAVADRLPTTVLRIAFGLFEIAVALQMLLGLRPKPSRTLPGPLGLATVGGGIGTISSVLGIGGGTLTVPFLVWCNVSMRRAVATSAACGLPIAAAGAAGFLLAGMDRPDLPRWASGYIYWPAVAGVVAASALTARTGAWLAHNLPVATLKRVFAVVLIFVGMRMLLRT